MRKYITPLEPQHNLPPEGLEGDKDGSAADHLGAGQHSTGLDDGDVPPDPQAGLHHRHHLAGQALRGLPRVVRYSVEQQIIFLVLFELVHLVADVVHSRYHRDNIIPYGSHLRCK